jgi:hypothetical protein
MSKKKFARCILHIGTEKTGTTSIQEFLAGNRARLAADGFLYPSSLGETNHFYLAVHALAPGDESDISAYAQADFGMDLPGFRTTLAARFREEAGATSARTLIVSSEHLHSRLVSDEEKRSLLAFLAPYCERIQVLVYLRRQDKVASSLVSTAFKNGHTNIDGIYDAAPDLLPYYYDYRALLEGYARVFGKETLRVRLFEEPELLGGDAVRDFMAQIGMPEFAEYVPIVRRNESLTPVALRFLSVFNRRVPLFVNQAPNPLWGNLVAVLEEHYSGAGYTPPRRVAEAFYRAFEDSNRWVRQEFFPHRATLFSEDFSSCPEEEAHPGEGVTGEEMAELAATLWEAKQRQVLELRQNKYPKQATELL